MKKPAVTVLKRLWKMWTIFCGIAVLLVVLNYVSQWMNPPQDISSPSIECIDSGGTWDAENASCIRAS
jgi:hypothetical protein